MSPRIGFIYQHPSPFVLQDRDVLRKRYEVKEFHWSQHQRPARALSRWLVANRREVDLLFIWFGDLHATVATRVGRVLGKPSILVVGGYDVNAAEGYGFLSTRAGLRRATGHFRRASRILAVSESLRAELVRTFPFVASKTQVVPTGVDVEKFHPGDDRQQRVLSVAEAGEWKRAWVKGWDRVLEAARLLPDVPFRLVGASHGVAREFTPPPNVEIRNAIPQAELVREYQTAAVYLQPSRTEGLPNTVMEAMACGCVPVVTDVGGMPELVDGVGFVASGTPPELSAAITEALRSPNRSAAARGRIVSQYPMERREAGLTGAIEQLLRTSAT